MENAPQTLTGSETLQVLTVIAGYHPPQDLGDGVVAAWCAAFHEADITSLRDAVKAVVQFYADPTNTDPWIKPWHVVGGVRAMRSARLKKVTIEEVTADLDPDDPSWGEITKQRLEAVADDRSGEMLREVATRAAANRAAALRELAASAEVRP